ncbi:MAG: bifunctional phosphoribosylaminoimidazolecarboxamide formyltransferase/inosine monophosphate cyclohydrolase [Chloroflexi bacterium]|nr:MAG: bifunctional phosphoribosylaminoimidazolecarboxamide formyltransferase/inosine monophosphate cyclohydrolase [Chloroflexota bacterium]
MRALISVYDKTGLLDFATGLREMDVSIVATDGTYEFLRQNNIEVTPVSDVTSQAAILGGRVKTLHPAVFGAILADRGNQEHNRELSDKDIEPFDLVVVNLYPFVDVISRSHPSPTEMLEYIDIGGPALIRAAAKNFDHVTVLVEPDDYEDILAELYRYRATRDKTRRNLAAKAFAHTAAYDAFITSYMYGQMGQSFPAAFSLPLTKIQDLRYGENLHQQAALYMAKPKSRDLHPPRRLAMAEQLHGKELSFNNILDADAAWSMVSDFSAPTVAIVKHTNPAGLAAGKDLHEAFEKAYAADPQAAYGGIIGINRTLDERTAEQMVASYFEVVVAPDYTLEAVHVLSRKKAIRLLSVRGSESGPRQDISWLSYAELDFKRIDGGFLVQTRNVASDPSSSMQVVSKRQPTLEELTDLHFAWRAVKHAKSNAIVLAKKLALVGVGAGQMSRVNAVDLACRMASDRARGSVLASDAFFPWPDGVERAVEAGVTAIIQPGGSIRDREAIDAADHGGVAMLFTGLRHFKH